jgi:hypothetical protein
MKIGQRRRHQNVDPSQQMVLRNAIIEAEPGPASAAPSSPNPPRRSPQQTESPFGASLNAFIDSIGHKQT